MMLCCMRNTIHNSEDGRKGQIASHRRKQHHPESLKCFVFVYKTSTRQKRRKIRSARIFRPKRGKSAENGRTNLTADRASKPCFENN